MADEASGCAWLVTTLACVCAALLVVRSSRRMHFYARYLAYYSLTSLILFAAIPFFLLRPCSVVNSLWAAHLWLRHVTHVLGITWRLRGRDFLAEERGGVVVLNHQSSLDVLGMFQIWKTMGRCSAVCKREAFFVWPFGLAAWLGGVVFIDRQHPQAAVKRLKAAARLMQRDKTKMLIFPEGTRNHSGVSLLPFKKGAFRLAIACQVPVLPVVFSPYHFIDYKTHTFGNGEILIEALAPIPTTGLTMDDVDSLTERTKHAMQAAYDKLGEEVRRTKVVQATR